MLDAIGSTLPQAVGIAASPFPIIAVILILMAPNSKRKSLLFLLGWVLGITVTVTVCSFVISLTVDGGSAAHSQPILGIVKLALGVLLLLLALRQWQKRPRPGVEPELPKWMARIDDMNPATVFGLSFVLAIGNPKNLIMAAAAGAVIGASRVELGDSVWVILLFVLIATASVTLPVIASVAAPRASAGVLLSVRSWLLSNNATIMMVLCIVLAANSIGAGISAF